MAVLRSLEEWRVDASGSPHCLTHAWRSRLAERNSIARQLAGHMQLYGGVIVGKDV